MNDIYTIFITRETDGDVITMLPAGRDIVDLKAQGILEAAAVPLFSLRGTYEEVSAAYQQILNEHDF